SRPTSSHFPPLDNQRTRRPDLVHRLSRIKLLALSSLRDRLAAVDSDGRGLGHPDRRATCLRDSLANLLRQIRMEDAQASDAGLAAVLRRWANDGLAGRGLHVLFHRRALGLLPSGEAALRFYGAVQEEEQRPRAD